MAEQRGTTPPRTDEMPARPNPGEVARPGTDEAVCPTCQGTGLKRRRPCPDCGGAGVVTQGIAAARTR